MTVQRTGRFPWPIALVLFIAAAVTREPVVLIAAAAALAGWAVSFASSGAALRGVDIDVSIAPTRMVAGDTPSPNRREIVREPAGSAVST